MQTRRARILLSVDEGHSPTVTARLVHISRATVHLWHLRYRAEGLDGLVEIARGPGGRRLSTRHRRAQPVSGYRAGDGGRNPLEHAADGAVRRVKQWQVRQVWRTADVNPHRLKTFKLRRHPQVAENVIDVVGLHLDPPDNAIVLSVNEITLIQALDRTRPMLPLRPGQIQRRAHDYNRHAIANPYAAANVAVNGHSTSPRGIRIIPQPCGDSIIDIDAGGRMCRGRLRPVQVAVGAPVRAQVLTPSAVSASTTRTHLAPQSCADPV